MPLTCTDHREARRVTSQVERVLAVEIPMIRQHPSSTATATATVDIRNQPLARQRFDENLVSGRNIKNGRHCIDPMVACNSCQSYVWIQEGTSTSDLSFSICCEKGQVRLPEIKPMPEVLRLLGNNNFLNKIRKYNAALSFTSMGVQVDENLANGQQGVYTFRIQGQVVHRIGSLLPPHGEEAKFAQIYILDPMEQATRRNEIFGRQLDLSVLRQLQRSLDRINPFCRIYKSIREREDGQDIEQLRIVLRPGNGTRGRRYNLPTCNEVAVLLPGEPSDIKRDIVIEGRDGDLRRVDEFQAVYDPLQYILLHPRGEDGWTYKKYKKQSGTGTQHTGSPRFVSAREFYAYRLQIRSLSETDHRSYFWMSGRLMHQYVVDQYAKIETERLRFLRFNQDTLRAELYQGVTDAIGVDAPAARVGRRIVLPSTFQGSPRHMQQQFQDAMAMVREYGKPDLFITFTCNPRWDEITKELYAGQVASDRPDLVVRLFKIKLQAFLDDVLKAKIFGTVVAHTMVVEFQKRGLPHIHMLLILASECKPHEPEDIDGIVAAEVPDPVKYPKLFGTVTTSMIHGPCGVLNPRAQCMKDGKCSKRYPMSFSNETKKRDDGYPSYRRRNDFSFTNRTQEVIDSRWVVPYNPWLATKYNAHINVEVCTSIAAVKYLYKYIHKGHDRASMAIDSPAADTEIVDEIQEFVDSRYVSTYEALWRIFGFNMHAHSPTVVRLPVHLEDQHQVYFRDEERLDQVMERNHESKLLAWFKLNQNDSSARAITYREIPKHFQWDVKSRSWKRRQRAVHIISRLYFVHPHDRERFCLRLLLLNVKGAKSYHGLREVNGVIYSTFRDAALALGLLEDDQEWHQCLEEAAVFQHPKRLRHLFAMILYLCQPSEPLRLWECFSKDLSEDFLYQARTQPTVENDAVSSIVDSAKRKALIDIDNILKGVGSRLENFSDLPQCLNTIDEDEIQEQDDIEHLEQEALRTVPLLNDDQLTAFNTITETIDGGTAPRLYFIDGPAGTGKTFLYNSLIAYIRGVMRKRVIVVASSGIAALILHGGHTAHSTFKVPIPIQSDSTCYIKHGQKLATRIQDADVIFWDEAPTQHRFVFEAVDRTFRDIMKVQEAFGGKLIIFGGDFRQVLPVVPKGFQRQIEDACLKNSKIWTSVTTLRLIKNMRVVESPECRPFVEFLLRVGDGQEPTTDAGLIEIPDEILFKANVSGTNESIEKQFIRAIYPGISNGGLHPDFLMKRVILTALNEEVDTLNELATMMLPGGDPTVYKAQDSIPEADGEAAGTYPTEYLNSLQPSGFPPYELKLKVSQPIILLRNMDPNHGLCNGTRLIVRALGRRSIEAEIALGEFRNTRVYIPRIPLITPDDGTLPVIFCRRQFPVRAAFAMTINKSQGQTLEAVGVYLPRPVFSHGQLYVALSRCNNPRNLKVLIKDSTLSESTCVFTSNIVYKRVLV